MGGGGEGGNNLCLFFLKKKKLKKKKKKKKKKKIQIINEMLPVVMFDFTTGPLCSGSLRNNKYSMAT